MKNTSLKHLSLLASLSLISLTAIPVANRVVDVRAADSSLPTTISLNDSTESEVRSYYSSLDSLDPSELKGANLLKNLKTILAKNNTFYDYGTGTTGIGAIYMITDRNWDASPAESLDSSYGTYDASTNTITNYNYKENPYLFLYYVDHDYQKTNPIKHKEDGASRVSFDKEHLWAKSHGFGLEGDDVVSGAGTDLHHLVAANPSVNSAAHNAYSYGYVSSNAYKATATYLEGNKRGTPVTTHTGDECQVVFEPQDADKGDVARALFYMVARYNYIGDTTSQPTKADPNLELVDHIIDSSSGFDCSTSKEAAPYGVISDILQWNKFDSPDQYEIHRNNLVYNNYQHNRNPFIDFPTWVDLIWNSDGSYYTGDDYAKPATDEMNVGNQYVEPTKGDTNKNDGTDMSSLLQNKTVLIIIGVVAVIVIIVVIILVASGKAKVKVSKSGKVSVKPVYSSSSSSTKKKSSSSSSAKKKSSSSSSSKSKKK